MPFNPTVQARIERTIGRYRRLSLYFSALAGIVMLLVATRTRAGTMPFIGLVGVGSSVIASAFFLFLTASRERSSVVLLDQGVEQLFDNRGYAFDDGYWESLLEQSSKHFRVLGVANHGYVRPGSRDRTEDLLRRALQRKVDVEIYWLDPTSEFAGLREKEEGNRNTIGDTIESIRWFSDFRKNLTMEELRQRLKLGCYQGLPTNGITWVDDVLVVTHYLPREQNRVCPGMVLRMPNRVLDVAATMRWRRSERSVASKYAKSFDNIKGSVQEISDAFIANLVTIKVGDKPSEAELRKGEPGA